MIQIPDVTALEQQAERYEAKAAALPEQDPARTELLRRAAALRDTAKTGVANGLGLAGHTNVGAA